MRARSNEVDDGVPINDWARYFKTTEERKGTFTADAVVIYDLDADGKGPRKWQLHGTPPILWHRIALPALLHRRVPMTSTPLLAAAR